MRREHAFKELRAFAGTMMKREDAFKQSLADSDITNALTLVDQITSMAEDLELPEEAEEFAASVKEKALSIAKTIEERQCLSDKQLSTLENMHNGLRRWLRGYDEQDGDCL